MADYNINAISRKVSYTGSAGVGPYAFSFEVLDQTDVAVYKNATLLTLTTDYTVTVNANGTGSITLVVAATAADTIVILGARDIERTTDFVTAGDLRASSLNEQLDSLTIFDQQIDERVERSIKAPPYDPTGINMTLPAKADRASKFMTFDLNGDVSTSDLSGLSEIVIDNIKIDGSTVSSLSGDIEISPNGSSEVNVNSNLNVVGTVEFDGLSGTGSVEVTNILDEDNMASNSATALATQQSIKAYVDTTVAATNEVVEDTTPQLGGNLDLNSNDITGTGNIDITGSVTPDSITTPALSVEPTSDHVILNLRNTATNTFGDSRSYHEIRWEAKDLVGVDTTYGEIEGRTVATGSRGKLNFNVKDASGLAGYLTLDGDNQNIKALKDVDVTGDISVSGTVDGRDLATDGTKLDGIETGADVTDTTNVTAAGALMDSEVTNLADVKSFDPSDYATAAQGTTADSALQDGDTVSSLTITSADINSGNIDNTVIGNSTAAAGTFTSLDSDDLTIEPTSDHAVLNLRNTATNTFGDSRSYHEIRWDAKDLVGVDETYAEVEGRTVATGSRGKLAFNVKGASGLTGYLTLDGDDENIKALQDIDVTGTVTADGLDLDGVITADATDATVTLTGTASASVILQDTGAATNQQVTQLLNNGGDFVIRSLNDTKTGLVSTIMTMENLTGNVGIGTSPSAPLTVQGGTAANATIQLEGGSGTDNASIHSLYNLYLKADSSESIANRSVVFQVGSTEVARFDSSGALLVGTTDKTIYNDTADEYGFVVEPTGEMQLSANNRALMYLNRQNGDGDIVSFRKDGAQVGSIGTTSSGLVVGSGDTGLFFDSAEDSVKPRNSDGSARDNAIDLGKGSHRFKDLYLSGGVYLGGTGAANKLDDYEEGTWTPVFTGWSTTGTTSVAGKYTKVGNVVVVTGQFRSVTGSIASTGGTSTVTGLPFSISGHMSFTMSPAQGATDGGVGANSGDTLYAPTISSTFNDIYFQATYHTS